KGNLVLVSRLRESGLDPMVIRLILLGHHYRSDWQWDEADVSAAGARLDKWRGAAARPAGAATAHVVTDVLTALATDLDAPFALRLLDHWANATDFGDDTEIGAGEVIRAVVDAALGVQL
ncbi:MAG: cysteine--1-D-myo-inosityl 2-amino-2-deoxy-alpha-D-glucopyranoside ligase, partial [Marmoricola sp.]